jgi:Ca2+:H+ antiporter
MNLLFPLKSPSNHLAKIPGICFTIGGINNARTGFENGIEQYFNSTVFGIVAQLTFFGAVVSGLLYTFLVTASGPSSIIEIPILNLSHYMSVVQLCIFSIWLWFRCRSHAVLFDYENLDGYEDESRLEEPQLSPWIDLLVILICLIPLVSQTDSIALSLHRMSPELRKWLIMFLMPILLPIDRHVKAIRLILKDKVDDSLDLSLGFSITLCLFVGPILVVLSWSLGEMFKVQFDLFGTVAYLLGALLITYIVADGRSNWIEGIELLVVYLILMLAYTFIALY